MENPTKKQFKAEVAKEIKYLAKNITEQQKTQLDITTFNANNIHLCIYGQLFGCSCYTIALDFYPRKYAICANWSDKNSFEDQIFIQGKNYTGLEKYVLMVDKEMHKHIISYLKGEIKHLRLYL